MKDKGGTQIESSSINADVADVLKAKQGQCINHEGSLGHMSSFTIQEKYTVYK